MKASVRAPCLQPVHRALQDSVLREPRLLVSAVLVLRELLQELQDSVHRASALPVASA